MEAGTSQAISSAIGSYETKLKKALNRNAIRAHIQGDLLAHRDLGIIIDYGIAQEEAAIFGREYATLMEKEGATIINGKKVAWVRDHKIRTRREIADVINRGIKEGKPTGVKYPSKGTISHDLKELFKAKNSDYVRIARSETARIQNIGTLDRYKRNDITEVTVLDDEGPNSCEVCAEANGQVWTIEYARTHESEHPNCVRAFAPVVR